VFVPQPPLSPVECSRALTVPEGRWVVSSSGEVTFTAVLGFAGVATIGYRATDAYGQTGTGMITVTVAATGPPVVTGGADVTTGVVPVTVVPVVSGSGVDGTKACVFVPSPPLLPVDCSRDLTVPGQGRWRVDAAGAVTFTAELGYTGMAVVTYRATDAYGQAGIGTVTVTVAAPGGPQVPGVSGQTTGVTPVTVTPVPTGAGIDPLQACVFVPQPPLSPVECSRALTVPEGRWVVSNTGEVTFTAVLGFAGVATIGYRATDAYGQNGTGTITVTVAAPGGPQVPDVGDHTTGVTPVTVTPAPTGAGIDPAKACVTVATLTVLPCSTDLQVPEGHWVVSNTGQVTFTAALGFSGPAMITYRATDAYGRTGVGTITVTVAKPTGPVVADDTVTTPFGTSATLGPVVTATGNDPSLACLIDTDHVCGPAITVPATGTWTVDPDTGHVTFAPAPGFHGPATATYRATDRYAQSGTATLTVTVGAPTAPVLTAPGDQTGTSGQTATITLTVTPGSGAVAGYCIVVGPSCPATLITAQGSWAVTGAGEVTFTAGSEVTGAVDPITVRVTDEYGMTATCQVTLTVLAPVPDGSVAGVVWIDLNHNGVQDAGEPVLPAVQVTLTPTLPAAVTHRSGRAAPHTPTPTYTQVTDSGGHYQFTVPAGDYAVHATVPTVNLTSGSSPSDANADWTTPVVVAADRTAQAPFAAVGDAALGGQAQTTTGGQIPDAAVTCTWAGADNILGTSDDVLITATADASGVFSLGGIPGGVYTCTGVDPVSGQHSAAAEVTVDRLSSTPAEVVVRVPVSTPTPAAAPAPAAPRGVLASTGAALALPAALAGWLLVAGLLLVAGARRARRGGRRPDRVDAVSGGGPCGGRTR
jgi:CshA-type fibril repeat protein